MTTKPQLSFLERLLNPRHWRITIKLITVMLILALIPLLIATTVITNSSSEAITEQTDFSAGALTEQADNSSDVLTNQTRVSLSRLAFSTSQRIEQYLLDNHLLIRMAASDSRVREYFESSDEEVKAETLPEIYGIINNVIAASYQPDLEISSIDLMGFYDLEGVVIAHNLETIVGQSYVGRDFVDEALAGNQFTATIQIGRNTGVPGINASAPVTNEDEEVIGATATRIRPEFITNILQSTLAIESEDITQTERDAFDIYLVNEYRLVMAHTDEDSEWAFKGLGEIPEADLAEIDSRTLLGSYCPGQENDSADAQSCETADRIKHVPSAIPALEELGDVIDAAIDNGTSGSYRYCQPNSIDAAPQPDSQTCVDGNWHVVGYAPVRDPFRVDEETEKNLNLFMVVVDLPENIFLAAVEEQRVQSLGLVDVQRDQGDAAVNDQRTQGYGIAIIMGAIAIFASVLVARTVASPIGKLASAAERVEHDLPFEPSDIADLNSQDDEIGNLSRVFSDMVVALRARMAELETIYEIGTNITSSVDLKPTLFYIVEALGRVIPFDAAEVSLYDKNQKKMVMNVETGTTEPGQTVMGRREYDTDTGYIAKLMELGGGFMSNNMDTDGIEDAIRGWDNLKPKAYVGVPLKVKDQVIGTIELVTKKSAGFSSNHLRTLETIAIQAAVAVQNATEVQTREQKLKQQIQRLRIEVDEARKQQQVAEITDTDYFQELAERARTMRNRKHGEADQSEDTQDKSEEA